jgi:galactose mutarotase-like enzyme
VAEQTQIKSGALTAVIAHRGAELISWADDQQRELMSDGNPAFWRGRAPILFPIVGRLNDDALRLGDDTYAMQKHGFARKSDFAVVDASENAALLRLHDNAESRAQYPFSFELDAEFRIDDNALFQTVTVRNTGETDMPFSFGYHPAFAWPLPFGGAREDHEIRFEHDEPAALARVTPYGTIGRDPVPTPVAGHVLPLNDALFANDALVWRDVNSHRLTYGAPGYRHLDISFPDTPNLGIWTKPNAAFICVEPWAGIADPEGYAGDFRDKPGINMLKSTEERSFRMNISLILLLSSDLRSEPFKLLA